jgi:hypothetical protein
MPGKVSSSVCSLRQRAPASFQRFWLMTISAFGSRLSSSRLRADLAARALAQSFSRRLAGVGRAARLGLDRLDGGQHLAVGAVVLDELVGGAGDGAVLVAGALVQVDPVQGADPVAGAELGERPALPGLLLALEEDAGPRDAAGGLAGLEASHGHDVLLADMGKMSTRKL